MSSRCGNIKTISSEKHLLGRRETFVGRRGIKSREEIIDDLNSNQIKQRDGKLHIKGASRGNDRRKDDCLSQDADIFAVRL